MTEERRFKIRKINKYEEELSNEKSTIIISSLVLGTAALLLCMTKDMNNYYYNEMQTVLTDSNLRNYYASLFGEVMSNIGVALNSANLMISLTNRTKLKSKIEELKEEFGPLYEQYLEEYDQEENKGRGR